MSWVEDWTVVAACRGMDPDELFVQGAAQNRAKTVCSGCPVRAECQHRRSSQEGKPRDVGPDFRWPHGDVEQGGPDLSLKRCARVAQWDRELPPCTGEILIELLLQGPDQAICPWQERGAKAPPKSGLLVPDHKDIYQDEPNRPVLEQGARPG